MTIPFPTVALLSNGSYNVLVTGSGAGYSTWRGYDVTRWREDATRDCWGQFCYVRDLSNGKVWSVGRQPLFRPADAYDYDFAGDKAEFRRRSGDIETVWTVCVAPDADVEVRVLAIVNHGKRARTLELTSYSEVSLNHRRADQAHPAFAKLFIETHFDGPTGALFARRRPRDSKEKPIWAVHVSASDQPARTPVEFETDRLAFIGRGRTAANPRVFDPDMSLSKTSGPVLDPVFCLRRSVHLGPNATARVAFSTGAADERVVAHTIAEPILRFHRRRPDLLGSVRKPPKGASRVQSDPAARLRCSIGWRGRSCSHIRPFARRWLSRKTVWAQSALWPFAISGDLPIVLVRMLDADEPLLRELMEWHAFSRRRGLRFDLVMVDETGGDIARSETLTSDESAGLLGQSGGYFLLSAAELSQAQMTLIAAAARIVLRTGRGPLAEQLDGRPAIESASRPAPPAQRRAIPSSNDNASSADDLLFWNGFGGFTPDGKEYVIEVDGTGRHGPALPPATMDQRHCKSEFRLPGDRSRPWLHMVRQQPDEPADAVVERSGLGSARRGRLLARRGDRRVLDADAIAPGTAIADKGPSRTGLHAAIQSAAGTCNRNCRCTSRRRILSRSCASSCATTAAAPAACQRHILRNGFSAPSATDAAMQVVCERDARIGRHRGAQLLGRRLRREDCIRRHQSSCPLSHCRSHGVPWPIWFCLRTGGLGVTESGEPLRPLARSLRGADGRCRPAPR